MSFQSEYGETKKRIILTGATGFVGEGVLFECLAHDSIGEILIVGRKHYEAPRNSKIKELIVQSFFNLDNVEDQLKGYDGCFYCSGKSSVGMSESDYTHLTYDTPMHFANKLVTLNPGMVFCHISGGHTDSTEQGNVMWARVKGKVENDLIKLPFKGVYNFRPALMKPFSGQKNVGCIFRCFVCCFTCMSCNFCCCSGLACSMEELGLSMIKCMLNGYSKNVLEVADIVKLANIH
jgi:hypothetical protein